MKNLKLFILVPIASIILFSCNNDVKPTEENKAKEDSIKTAEKIAQVAEEKKKNPFLIEPPKVDYTGEYLDKYSNGNTKFKGFYRFGKRHGQWMAFYSNGIMWSECVYLEGLRQGPNNAYYENGNFRYKGWYKNDMRDSTWLFYDEQGKEVNKVKFKNDEEVVGK